MSVQASSWAIEQACATATEKAVLLVVASYAGPDGTCYPGQETIARQACCSVKTVERALAAFEAKGWITRKHRQRRDGSRTSDLIYMAQVANPEARDQPDTESDRADPTRHPVQSKQTPCPIQTDTVSGLTTFEPLGEPLGEDIPAAPKARQTPTKAQVDEIWTSVPRLARQRSSKSELMKALSAAMMRGHSPESVKAGLDAAYASKTYAEDRAKGVHLLVQNDRWESWVEDARGAWDDDRWSAVVALNREEGWWTADLGPPPGSPGCRVPAHLLQPRQGLAA